VAGPEEFVALGELADDLIRRVPPALVRCHVVVDSSSPEDRATESHNDWTTRTGSPHDPEVDLSWLIGHTHWSAEELTEVIDTLKSRRPQIILSGPPGTGKTWVAEKVGLYLTGGIPDAVYVVQFHPTYAYEDFVEGLRPDERNGQVT
jgi:hypothetical protein